MQTPVYDLTLIQAGNLGLVPGPEIFWMSHFGEWFPLHINVFLVEGEHHVILVNTGPPVAPWAGRDGVYSHMRRLDPDPIVAALTARGLAPTDVDTVILTPLQAYAVGGLAAFSEATVCIARKGWTDLMAPLHFDERRYMAIPDPILNHLVFDVWPQQRLHLLDDEAEIFPGIRTWWAGAHHRSSLAIEVDTPQGTAVITDTVFYRENIERMHLLGIAENLEECRRTYDRIRARSDIVLSPYDPRTRARYPYREENATIEE